MDLERGAWVSEEPAKIIIEQIIEEDGSEAWMWTATGTTIKYRVASGFAPTLKECLKSIDWYFSERRTGDDC